MRSRCCLYISAAYFINPLHRFVCIYFPTLVAWQRLGKYPPYIARKQLVRNVTAATNRHSKIEKLLDASFLCGQCRIKESRLVVPSRNCCYWICNPSKNFRVVIYAFETCQVDEIVHIRLALVHHLFRYTLNGEGHEVCTRCRCPLWKFVLKLTIQCMNSS
jgi:hypothetical protein